MKFSDLYSTINNIIKPFLIINYYEMDSLCTSTNDFSKDICVVVWLPVINSILTALTHRSTINEILTN